MTASGKSKDRSCLRLSIMVSQPIDDSLYQSIVALRRDLHAHPELSWQEERTAGRIADFLAEHEIPSRRLAGTGVVAEIGKASSEHPCVVLRADIDALPVHEETGLAFASETEDVMHACGHDGHSAMLAGAAVLLSQEGSLPAPVRLLFQPGEEQGNGALAMIDAGALEDAAFVFGGHLDRHYPLGSIVVSEGPVNASSDTFHVEIFSGEGGHAARPHETVDAVVVGSLFVMAIQTIVSREVNPAHPSVVTVGRFESGSAANVIAGRATLEGTIRAQDPEVREFLCDAVQRIAKSVGQLHGAEITAEIGEGTPAVVNPPDLAEICREAARQTVGSQGIRVLDTANMGAEDFGHYLTHVPGCYVRFGYRQDDVDSFPAHSSKFDFDEQALAVGAVYYHRLALAAGKRSAKPIPTS